jgi:hypothetical protein
MSCARCGRERPAAGSVELVLGRRTRETEYGIGVQTTIETTEVSNNVEFIVCNRCLHQRVKVMATSLGLLAASLGLFLWAIMTHSNPPGSILLVCLVGVITSISSVFIWRYWFLAPLLRSLKPEVRSGQLLNMTIRRIR